MQQPSPPIAERLTAFRDRDDEAWERYEDRKLEGQYAWTYDGDTVVYTDKSWQHHEPDTFQPKRIRDRFYNELSPDHVNNLLAEWEAAKQKGRVREHLEQAAHVTYMRRKQSDEARALAGLLTRQCIETYKERCSWMVFKWRAGLLTEQGLTSDAIALLTQRINGCREQSGRDGLLEALRGVERKAKSKAAPKPKTPRTSV